MENKNNSEQKEIKISKIKHYFATDNSVADFFVGLVFGYILGFPFILLLGDTSFFGIIILFTLVIIGIFSYIKSFKEKKWFVVLGFILGMIIPAVIVLRGLCDMGHSHFCF